MKVNVQDVNAGEENPDTRFGEESCFTWIFLSSCSRSSWSSKQGNRVIIYAVPMQYIGTRRSLMSLIIFIEISIFSRGCYEHATPPYSTESPESRDKCSGVGAVWASKYACRVQDQSQCAGPVHIYFVCYPKNGWFTERVRQALSQRDIFLSFSVTIVVMIFVKASMIWWLVYGIINMIMEHVRRLRGDSSNPRRLHRWATKSIWGS